MDWSRFIGFFVHFSLRKFILNLKVFTRVMNQVYQWYMQLLRLFLSNFEQRSSRISYISANGIFSYFKWHNTSIGNFLLSLV